MTACFFYDIKPDAGGLLKLRRDLGIMTLEMRRSVGHEVKLEIEAISEAGNEK